MRTAAAKVLSIAALFAVQARASAEPASYFGGRARIFFEGGGGEISPAQMPLIRELARRILALRGTFAVVVEGHEDAEESRGAERGIGLRRAEAVRAALVSTGCSEATLTARGFGARWPAATNTTSEGRALNRRVEIAIRRSVARASSSGASRALVVSVRGRGATIIDRRGEAEPLRPSAAIYPGERVGTEPGGSATLRLPGALAVVLRGDTELWVLGIRNADEVAGEPAETRLRLHRGGVELRAFLSGKEGGGRAAIETSLGRWSASAGEARLGVAGDRARVSVSAGGGFWRTSSGEVSVGAGQGLVIEGAALSAAESLLGAPVADGSAEGRRLAWKAVPKAKGYRLELASDARFLDLRHASSVEATSAEVSLPEGAYYWRVAARDARGLLGVFDAPKAIRITGAASARPPRSEPAVDAPKGNAPKEDPPKEDSPKEDSPKEDPPKEDPPKEDSPAP